MSIRTQNELILAHLKRRSITPLEALEKYGCFRLAARIHDLRSSGHDIGTVRVHDEDKVYARYFLK